jgi:hypothetical protein
VPASASESSARDRREDGNTQNRRGILVDCELRFSCGCTQAHGPVHVPVSLARNSALRNKLHVSDR